MSEIPTGGPVVAPYSYELPRDRIAQRPVHPPESARMLVVDRSTGSISHSTFAELRRFLRAGDRLVFNETKVIPARLFGNAAGADVEILLTEQVAATAWRCLARPLRRVKAVGSVQIGDVLRADLIGPELVDRAVLEFTSLVPDRSVCELLEESGTMPIPPYIRSGHGDQQDRVDYQSIFAKNEGSIAAPTASLHFTSTLIDSLRQSPGCDVSTLTLHVGTASFQPVVVDGGLRPPATERFVVPSATMAEIESTKRSSGRIVAVGTTTTRALETAAAAGGEEGETGLFIQPGFSFRVVDALVTNFHQPGTTHLLLVEALLGRDLLAACYDAALGEGYRFLSYGDGMLIV